MKKNRFSLAIVGAISILGIFAAVAGFIGHFLVGGPVPSLVAGVALLIVSAAIWHGKHAPKTIEEGEKEDINPAYF